MLKLYNCYTFLLVILALEDELGLGLDLDCVPNTYFLNE